MSCELQQELKTFDQEVSSSLPTTQDLSSTGRNSSALTASSERRQQILTRTFERDVLPRLVRRSPAESFAHDLSVERLANLSVRADAVAVVAAVMSIYHPATDIDQILLDLLAPTARLLGAWWADDLCSFADVTVGVGHLRTAMHILAPRITDKSCDHRTQRPRTLLMPLPGEQHSFGISMLATFFNRAGWDTRTETASDFQDLHRIIRTGRADMVGFSVSHVDMLDAARDAIAVVRAETRNPRLVVMVGGLPFTDDPSLTQAVGADATAIDGAQALITASELIGHLARKD